MSRLLGALTVTALALLVFSGCATSPEKPHATESRSTGKPFTGLEIDLSHDLDDLNGHVDPQGRRWIVNGNQAETNLVIRRHRLVRGNPANVGPYGAPSLVIPNPGGIKQMSVSYVFTPGQTSGQSVVLGSCHLSLATSSIQFLVRPDSWLLFSTLKSTDVDQHTDILSLQSGDFDHPLKVDGQTEYTTTMLGDPEHGRVTVSFPGGNQRTFTDQRITEFWGQRAVVQIMHPQATDGDAEITRFVTQEPD